MRRFVIIGQTATASGDFSLEDLPSTSGRLDVLLRCVRAALLVSHGLRRDTVVYLVLLGGPLAPRTVRVDGAIATYVRPDERSLAGLVRKVLATPRRDAVEGDPAFTAMPHGFAVAEGGLELVLADLGPFTPYLLDENAPDIRAAPVALEDAVFFLGDHVGVDEATRARLAAAGAVLLSVGPVSVHADDVVAIVANELDRRATTAAL